MSGLPPDQLLWRRVAALEREVQMLHAELRRVSTTRGVMPLAARLWRATLNEAFGDTDAHIASADLLSIGGTDTLLDVSLYDPLDSCSDLESGDAVVCFEQIDVDGARRFVPMGSGSFGLKPFCRFTLDAALATTDASKDATITHQYGYGSDHVTTDITVQNFLTHTAGTYQYHGASGNAGKAFYNPADGTWHIFDMECHTA